MPSAFSLRCPCPIDHYTPLARASFRRAAARFIPFASLLAILSGFGFVDVAAGQPPPERCAACVTLVVEPEHVPHLPGSLGGLPIVVRARAGEPLPVAVLTGIREAGGVPGILFPGIPRMPLDPMTLQIAARIFLDVSGEPSMAPAALDDLAFRLKTVATEIRGSTPDAQLGLIVTGSQLEELRRRDIAPYVDVIGEAAAPMTPSSNRPAWPDAGRPYSLMRLPDAAGAVAAAGTAAAWLWEVPADPAEAAALAQDLARARPLLVADLIPGGGVQVVCGGRRAETYLNPRTLDTVAIAPGCRDGVIEVTPPAVLSERVTLANGDTLLRIDRLEGQFADDVRVVGARALRVQEIVAKHQAVAARQRTLVHTLISTGSMTLTFEAPGFPAPMAIGSETVIYEGLGRTEIEQRSIRVNGMEFKGGAVPRLPIIEPERVASPPLTITLSDLYVYALAGRDRIGDTPCYVVSFEPSASSRGGESLFRGRAWIAADTFAMIKVVGTQTGLRGPIVSSEQVDEFTRQRDGVWLLSRSEVRQIYEGAAHRTPIHRVLAVATHDINPPDFEARRSAAYRSRNVMLRDTASGFRYLRRDKSRDPSQPGEPMVADAAHRVRTLAFGVIVDPNISRPLPFAGLSYVDFDVFGTGTQVNAFFGGTYGQLAFSVPAVAGSRWQIAGRAFGIASSYNDRAFDDGREIYERNITQRPAHASVWTLRPVTSTMSIRAGYDLDYTQFGASELTSGAFIVPADQVAHSLRVGLEVQKAGWNASLWWTGSQRSGWKAWGTEGDHRPGHADYQRFGASLARPFVLSPALVARMEAGWMSGRDLDRFSRYAFGTFDNRLRGYPSALIRYDRGGVARGAVAWALSRRLRVDGFFDSAYVHDPGFGPGLRHYSGVGAALEAPAPFGVLTSVEWGYGFQGVNANGGRGTHVVRFNAFKIF